MSFAEVLLLAALAAPAPTLDEDGFFLEDEDALLLELAEAAAPKAPAAPAPEQDPARSETDPPADLSRTVRARASAEAASETRLGRRELDAQNRRTAEDLLRRVPGVHVVQHGAQGKGHQLYLRGFDAVHGADVELTVDGAPLNEPSNVHGHGYLDITYVIPELVDELAALKGPLALDQGMFATAGSARFSTAAPRPGLTLKTELGNTWRARGLALFGGHDADTYFAAEAVQDAGFGQGRASRRASTMSRYGFDLGGLRARVGLDAYAAKFDLPGAVRLDDVEAGRVGLTDTYLHGMGGHSARAMASFALSGALLGGELAANSYAGVRTLALDETFTGPDARTLQEDTRGRAGARGTFQRRLTDGLRLDLAGAADLVVGSQRESGGRRAALDLTQGNAALAAGVRYVPTDWLRVDAGVRGELFFAAAEDGETNKRGAALGGALLPRARVALLPVDELMVFAGYGRGARAPEARDALNPGLEVPVADTLELGARWDGARLALQGAAFATLVEDEVTFDHATNTTLALSSTRRLGLEGGADLRATRALTVGADVAAVDARFLDSGEGIPGVPELLARVRGQLALPFGFSLAARAELMGSRALRFGGRAAPVALVDGSLAWERGAYRVDLAVDNALDAQVAEGAYAFASDWRASGQGSSALPAAHAIAGQPRTARLGLTLKF